MSDIEITQADIDRAHDLTHKGFATLYDYEMYLRGQFARHRIAAEQAKEVELKAVLDRESAGHVRHDAKLDELEAEIERLRKHCEDMTKLLTALQDAERRYRQEHDLHGDGSRKAGYAWDQMRKAGDRARKALAAYKENAG